MNTSAKKCAPLLLGLLLTACGTTTEITEGKPPTQGITAQVSGNNLTGDQGTVYGGGAVTITLTGPVEKGTPVTWSVSQGAIVGQGISAALPYSDINRQVLTGQPITVTAIVTTPHGAVPITVPLRVDDQAPQANGGVTATVPGRPAFFVGENAELPGTATFQISFTDGGVGLNPVKLSAYLRGLPVLGDVHAASELPEARGYTLRVDVISDRLGNRVDVPPGTVAGPFNVDFKAPVVTSSAPQGTKIQDSTVLTFTGTDPMRDDRTPGSGGVTLSSDKGGTSSGNTLTLTGAQLRAGGASSGPVTITVTATDAAGNATTFIQTVTLE
ncbi:M20 family dipeptidase [Deinococcus xianganensis]|uniref:Uncharacterized protein n=1 Tax=Deinococcus xianganensis TaxID=1507289 RepID=A0A6I4YFT8_9DEIO|nr:M20 family dipeptidase [Deinococcus xianganensis]MXV21219.1 hypothetical protein [Deinococcus xianganensis]